MLLLAVCAGFVGGPDEGALVGFAAGLISDLFLQSTPFGLIGVGRLPGRLRRRLGRAELPAARTCSWSPWWPRAARRSGWCCSSSSATSSGQAQLVAPGEKWVAEVALIEACYAAVFALPAAC